MLVASGEGVRQRLALELRVDDADGRILPDFGAAGTI
jgi:hypothetical protein